MSIDRLSEYPVHVSLAVAWGDMDAFGHVNNVVYFRYFETARIAYFDKINYTDAQVNDGLGPILASTKCRFRKPLRYPDQLTIGARVTEISEDRFTMAYRVYSHDLDAVAADGEALVVNFDYTKGTKTPIPDRLRNAMLALETPNRH